jgi:hypothetical protein
MVDLTIANPLLKHNSLPMDKVFWLLKEKPRKVQHTSATWMLTDKGEIGLHTLQATRSRTPNILNQRRTQRITHLFLTRLLILLNKPDQALTLRITQIIILAAETQLLGLSEDM